MRHLERCPISLPASQMRPESGISSRRSRRMKVVFPEPDGPTRKTNSPLSISTVQSESATVDPLYVLVTFWNLIMRKNWCGTSTSVGPSMQGQDVRPDIVPAAVGELGQPL